MRWITRLSALTTNSVKPIKKAKNMTREINGNNSMPAMVSKWCLINFSMIYPIFSYVSMTRFIHTQS